MERNQHIVIISSQYPYKKLEFLSNLNQGAVFRVLRNNNYLLGQHWHGWWSTVGKKQRGKKWRSYFQVALRAKSYDVYYFSFS